MLVWLTLPFYDICAFSVAVNTVYKLQFLHLSQLMVTTVSCPTTGRNAAGWERKIFISALRKAADGQLWLE